MLFGVSPEKQKALEEKMRRLGLREEDITEQFVRSGGKGGQNVNKTSTCVCLKYNPDGTIVKCSRERSQAINRYIARKILADKIERARFGLISEERQRIEKIRRQKRKRSKRAKDKMLDSKHMNSLKKQFRSHVSESDY